jgi:hypothetical protein
MQIFPFLQKDSLSRHSYGKFIFDFFIPNTLLVFFSSGTKISNNYELYHIFWVGSALIEDSFWSLHRIIDGYSRKKEKS